VSNETDTTPDVEVQPKTLPEKLLEVALVVDGMEKTGRNDHHKYDYVEAANVLRAIRKELYERQVIVLPGASNIQHLDARGGKGFITNVDLSYTFINVEDPGESPIVIPWVGEGADTGGDKGLYKAFTGALKYMLLDLFLIPTGDDPETDATSGNGETEQHKDADRPPATKIPQDRAREILLKAKAKGLVNVPENEGEAPTLAPVFEAKILTLVHTGKIGHLNVDQAVDLEAWLDSEEAVENG